MPSACQHLRAYPGGRVGRCDRPVTRVYGYRYLCDEHYFEFLTGNRGSQLEKLKAEERDSVSKDVRRPGYDVDEEKFRAVLKSIWDAPGEVAAA